ncbi:MAG: CoA ester lyase [Pseudomonadota bacterium]
MSFTPVERRADRLYRSKLFVPGSRPELFEKAAKGPADVICMDLEDAVAPSDKVQARKNIIEGLNEVDFGDKLVTIRINGLDTHYCYRDVIDVVEQGGERLDALMVPKVGVGSDIYAIDMLITQVETAIGRKRKIAIEVLLESAMGLENVNSICASSKRIETMHFGAADFAASMNMRTTNIGGNNPDFVVLTDPDDEGRRESHWADLWHYPLMRMVAAARAHGIVPIDGPFGDYSDPDGFNNQAVRTAILGCEGKWAIHPKQVALCNAIYTPPEAEVTRAKEILSAMEEAQAQGLGAATYKGMLIDAASIRQASVIVKKMEQIVARDGVAG